MRTPRSQRAFFRSGTLSTRARPLAHALSRLLVPAAVTLCGAARPAAAAVPKTVLNGAQPRPFYVFAHNPNRVDWTEKSIKAGANALEPDVNAFAPSCWFPQAPLMVAHGLDCSDAPAAYDDDPTLPTLDAYLQGLHDLAVKYPKLALVVFDIKDDAANDPDRGLELVSGVRSILNTGGVNLWVVYSVGKLETVAIFRDLLGKLLPNEGVQIDAEDTPGAVVDYFQKHGQPNRIGYSDGTLGPGLFITQAIDEGAGRRASRGVPNAIPYVYTLNTQAAVEFYESSGADGIIPDNWGIGEPDYDDITWAVDNLKANHPELRMAARSDNPFQPALESYALQIRTADVDGAGTDAHLTFELHGCKGSATITIDTDHYDGYQGSGRMEQGKTDWVTIPSKDLGELTSITVSADDSGNGPDWEFVDIRVSSARYIGDDTDGQHEYMAVPPGKLPGGKSFPLTLTPKFELPATELSCGPVTQSNAPGLCGAYVDYGQTAWNLCDDATIVQSIPSGSWFPVGTQTVSAQAVTDDPAIPDSQFCLFPVTVIDAEAPTIVCPMPWSVDATSPFGAIASYTLISNDNCGVVSTTCSLPLGSYIPNGDHYLVCDVTDAAQNQAGCDTTVHVRDADEQIISLAQWALDAPKDGVREELVKKLGDIYEHSHSDDLREQQKACDELDQLIKWVENHEGRGFTAEQVADVVLRLEHIEGALGCSLGPAVSGQ